MTNQRRIFINREGNYIDIVRLEDGQVTYKVDPQISFIKGLIIFEKTTTGYLIKLFNKKICKLQGKSIIALNEVTSTELRCIYEFINNETEENSRTLAKLNTGKEEKTRSKTELHTHLIEILSGYDFLNFCKQFNIQIPLTGYKLDFINGRPYNIEDLDEKTIMKITNQLSLDLDGVSSFDDLLERNSNRRSLLSLCKTAYAKDNGLSKDDPYVTDYLIYLLLKDSLNVLARQGVKYAEISYSNIRTLKFLLECDYSDIKIKFRLLKSIDRTDTAKAYRQAMGPNNIDMYHHPLLGGIDVMGTEEELTEFDFIDTSERISPDRKQYSFYYKISQLLPKLNKIDSSVLRLHAGEFKDASNNVEYSLQIIDEIVDTRGLQVPPPSIRIGHGININKNPNLIRLLKKYNCIIEFNISSNYALGHVDDLTKLPIKYYIENGIKYVLSTDGSGMYKTDIHQEEYIFNSLTRRENKGYLETEKESYNRGIL